MPFLTRSSSSQYRSRAGALLISAALSAMVVSVGWSDAAASEPAVVHESPGRTVTLDYEKPCTVADSGHGWSYSFTYPPVEPGLEFLWAGAVADMEDVRISFANSADSTLPAGELEQWESWMIEGGMSLLPAPDCYAVAMCKYWWFTGGAHGLNNTFLYRYALVGGPGSQDWAEIDSRDLLADSAELVRMSEIVIDTLAARLGPDPDMEWIVMGAGPYWENYSMLYPVPDSEGALAGFTVRFTEYAVGPYCFGQQEVFVPLGLLRP
ncbi:MAG TPA: hypothetical protein P5266_00060 [Candidatus Fermentibacter sp.]|nr:hypothetical protein [Candidatus Fermentibacter sp.]